MNLIAFQVSVMNCLHSELFQKYHIASQKSKQSIRQRISYSLILIDSVWNDYHLVCAFVNETLTRLMLHHCVISPDFIPLFKKFKLMHIFYEDESVSIWHIHAGIWLLENYNTSSGNRVACICGLPRGCCELKWVSSKVKIILYYWVIPRVLHSIIFIRSFFR